MRFPEIKYQINSICDAAILFILSKNIDNYCNKLM